MKKFKLREYNKNKRIYSVTILDIWCQNNKIVAYVKGTHIYKTEIMIGNNRINKYYCSCPASENGMSFCKHLSGVECYLKDHDILELEYIEPKEEKLDFNLSTDKIIYRFKNGIKNFLDEDDCINCYQSEYFSDYVFKYCVYIDHFLDQKQADAALSLTTAYLDYIDTLYVYCVDDLDDINEILTNYLVTLATNFNFHDNIKEYLLNRYQRNQLDDLGEIILTKIISTIHTKEQATSFIKLLKQIKIESYQEDDIKEKIKLLKAIS